jgi:hypothetical protein
MKWFYFLDLKHGQNVQPSWKDVLIHQIVFFWNLGLWFIVIATAVRAVRYGWQGQ